MEDQPRTRDETHNRTELTQIVADIVERPVTAIEVAEEPAGLMPNRRFRAVLTNGTRLFVKEATNDFTERLLERERIVYEALGAQPFLPRFFGCHRGVLVLEDLTGRAWWPPPWRASDLPFVIDVLDELAASPVPAGVPSLDGSALLRKWALVAEDPEPFLDLRQCTREWLDQAIPRLVGSDRLPLVGAALVHGDFRSDNLCIRGGSAIVFDWGAVAEGREDYDRTGFAISFACETGIPPEHVAPHADADLVAMLAGTLAYHAPHPSVPPRVRKQLQTHLRVALPWCARALGLAPPDGP